MEVDVNKTFKAKFPEATVKFLVGSEEVKNELKEVLGRLQSSEENRVNAEDIRVQNEEGRSAAEATRESNESSREAAERVRENAEENRVNAEDIRVQNEEGRSAAEATRESNESSREVAEQARGGREQQRETGEELRIRNEEIRDAHEQGRIRNEDERQEKELQRSAAESIRMLAEENRVNAEEERVAAEQNRTEKDIERGVLLQEHGQKIGEHTQSISDIESDLSDLSDAPRVEVDNARYKTVHVMDRASGVDIYPITIPEAVIDKDGKNIIEIIEKYWAEGNTEADVMYGVEWDVTVADSAMTRIGNMALHRQLPIQNRMKGCLLDDNGEVVEYLPPTSWLGATRDGSRGQVMVKVPYHYRKFETDGNIRRAKISEYPLPGYHYVPEMYISAYEATVQRSTNMLCSAVNSDADYRGGNNNATWDGTYRSLLGRPVSQYNAQTFQSWARNRNASATSEWNILDYTCWKAVQWLYLIEYANRNSQLPFSAERDANGYKRGGLGMGATTAPSTINDWNSQYAFIPCGYTDSLGNGSGEMSYTALNEDGSVFTEVMVNRYRGIENPFGHLGKICCGCLCVSKSSETDIYTTADASLYNFDATDGYAKMYSIQSSGGYFKDITFGEHGDIIPTGSGGGSTTFWCDAHWITSRDPEVIRPLAISGSSKTTSSGGMFAFDAAWGSSNANNGTRLCFIPKNNE